MCGIAGFYGSWTETLLDSMVATLRHRGPDGDGRFHDPEAGIALGHTRLAIIDLSDAASQPMRSPDGRFVITFNGEIYNYRTLRDELISKGAVFASESDTEVLLQLFARDGIACLNRLIGIFAFAVWDAHERRLVLARDQLGIKPLYYADLPTGFLFASELKALTLCADVPRDLDPVAVGDHMGFVWTAGERTMVKAVRKLRPGCAMVVDANGVRVDRYYRVPLAAPDTGAAHLSPEGLGALIDQVVRDQMVADVDVGALLSGGVDSSAIVASMCRATEPARVTTFCATVTRQSGAADNFGDDQSHARLVADALGVNNIEVPTDTDLIDALPDMIWTLDEPTADFAALQTLMLAREARRNGIKVLLSGVGGDDLFTGYGRHVAAVIYGRLGSIPGLRSLAASLLRNVPPSGVRGRRLQRVGALLSLDEDDMLAEAMSFSAVSSERRRSLLAADIRNATPDDGVPAALRDSLSATRGLDPVSRFLDLELNGFLPDHNLNYTDKMAMQAGVEVRVPLVDVRLVDAAMKIPTAQKIDLRQTKKILRRSQAARLPDPVLTRAKQGFGVPVRAWLHGPARSLLEDLTGPALSQRGLFDPPAVQALKDAFFRGRIDAAYTLFPMMAIELWCRALDTAPLAADARIAPSAS